MAAVDKASLNTNAFYTSYDILNDRKKIADPRDSQGKRAGRKMVYDSDPNIVAMDFGLFPYIVCSPAVKLPGKNGADQSTQEIVWTQKIKVLTLKEGSGQNRDDTGFKDMMELTDAIDEVFKSKCTFFTYLENKLRFVSIRDVSSFQQIILGDSMSFESEYEITFRSRMVVQ